LTDEGGELLPVLTPTETGELLASGMLAIAETDLGSPLDEESRRVLRSIIQSRSLEESDGILARIPYRSPIADLIHSRHGFSTLLQQTMRLSPLLVSIRDSPGTRRVFTYSYETDIARDSTWTIRRLLIDLAWAPVDIKVDVPGIEASREYLFRFSAPEGAEISHGKLTAVQSTTLFEGSRGPDLSAVSTQPRTQIELSLLHVPVGVRAEVSAALRPSRGTLAPFYWSILLVSISLIGALPWIFSSYSNNIRSDIALTQAQIAATLLIAIPGLLASFLAARREHPLLSQLLRIPKAFVALAGLTAYIAAATFAVGLCGSTLRVLWSTLACLATLFTAILSISIYAAKRRSKRG
jgi:hypothetical protein